MKYPWQDSLWERLRGTHERLPHALLLHGPSGIGKLALAEHFAQFLLCESEGSTRDEPCGACDACRWFLGGHHPDVRFIEPEAIARRSGGEGDEATPSRAAKPSQEIKVDQVRDLAAFLNVGSHRGARRVAVVHPAEDMNLSAANALLKGLEEPPSGAVFILVAHRPARLLPTIRSRCVPVPMPLPSGQAAIDWLGDQGVADAARWLRFAGGAPLRALEYAERERGAAITRVLDALASGDRAALRACAEREALDVLAEVLHKAAIDEALAVSTGARKYGVTVARGDAETGPEWLAAARRLGQHRALIRHPLNPRLFVAELLAAFPDAQRR